MYWIGVGFLIAIGFGLASVALPFVLVLLALAWEYKAGIGVGLVMLILLCLAIAYPQAIAPTIFWGLVILWLFARKNETKEVATYQEPITDVQPQKPRNNIAAINIKKDLLIVVVVISVFTLFLLLADRL